MAIAIDGEAIANKVHLTPSINNVIVVSVSVSVMIADMLYPT